MISIKFYLKSSSSDKAELIYLVASLFGKRLKVSTTLKCKPVLWDSEKQRCDTTKGTAREQRVSKNTNKLLNSLAEESTNSYNAIPANHNNYQFAKYMIEQKIKSIILGEKEEKSTKDKSPLEFFKDYVDKKNNLIVKSTRTYTNPRTTGHHRSVLKRIENFITDTMNNKLNRLYNISDSWDIFNSEFETLFQNWAIEKGYKINTITATFSVLKVWLNAAKEEGYVTSNEFSKYASKGQSVDNIYLSTDEIKSLYNLDIKELKDKGLIDKKSKCEITRDLFVLACYTGLRLSDWGKLNEAVWNIKNKTVTLITEKTKEKVMLPLSDIVIELYNKYQGYFPQKIDKAHSIEHLKHLGMLANIDDDIVVKENIKGVIQTKIMKKYQLIMNHTARRSFATNMFLAGAPTISIMKLTGHTTEANFMKYIKLTKTENVELMRDFINKI